MTIEEFIAKWSASGAAERANKDAFLLNLCSVLGVPAPDPVTGNPEKDLYVFEKDAILIHEGKRSTVGKIDLYRHQKFILEAKQGSDAGSKKHGTAKRGTAAWAVAMKDAYGQALQYARTLDEPPPFLIATDIGHCFDLYAVFDGSLDYRPFPNAQSNRIFLSDLAKHLDLFRKIWTEPDSLDPSKVSARVTRDVATRLAELAKSLEKSGHPPDAVATFLMRCLFTMFSEDVRLLSDKLFQNALREHWLPKPERFPTGIETLWRAMNEGATFGFIGKLLKFNGGLFAQPNSLPLNKEQLKLLLDAAECDWADVEPAIFGTLLERALDPKERHKLGAHFTPRAYVERLVKPAIEEPLRAEWDLVRAEVRRLVGEERRGAAKKPKKAAAEAKNLKDARKAVLDFHKRLCAIKVLDPACGSGNFLYVTLDLFKKLESEVFALLADLGDTQYRLELQTVTVSPRQFLGIEIKRWAKEIAELVLWIGFLQHHYRTRKNADGTVKWPEPVLENLYNSNRSGPPCLDRPAGSASEVPTETQWTHGQRASLRPLRDGASRSGHGVRLAYSMGSDPPPSKDLDSRAGSMHSAFDHECEARLDRGRCVGQADAVPASRRSVAQRPEACPLAVCSLRFTRHFAGRASGTMRRMEGG
jgi:hypothetical protein